MKSSEKFFIIKMSPKETFAGGHKVMGAFCARMEVL